MNGRWFLNARQSAYRAVFSGPMARQVLADLAKFCRANEGTFHADARVSAALDGRREVWLRVQQHLNLTPSDLFSLYGGVEQPEKHSDE